LEHGFALYTRSIPGSEAAIIVMLPVSTLPIIPLLVHTTGTSADTTPLGRIYAEELACHIEMD
jgi:hypothetical protein